MAITIVSCASPAQEKNQEGKKISFEIERLDPRIDAVIGKGVQLDVLAEGLDWTEGPLWIEDKQMLLFSDIPPNNIYQWTASEGLKLYLHPSGYTQETPRGGEVGSNGLLLHPDGQLVLAQHGDRRIAKMNAPLDAPEAKYETLADNYQGKKFNSPNDAVYKSNGDLYFTDPPYGLEKNVNDPLKEIPFQGVYRLKPNGEITLLLDSLTRPNGIAFLPDEKKIIIANSDPSRVHWYIYDVESDGLVKNGRIFFDATEAAQTAPGMPDGLKVDTKGHVFATGPGGIWIFTSEGEALGRIKIGQLVSNLSLSSTGKELYVTADGEVLRLTLNK
ncbi:MAG TPA: SMP-30/gluconolactonase/LRE family protein [Cyclobacteriaceae bacterium]|nr:SMP-30/gluconolactonase/LRE family protein [Cyclobacteriaceae bacterium]